MSLKYAVALGVLVSMPSFANEDVIKKSLSFHYGEYSKSQHSDSVAVVNWSSKDGIARLERTKYKGDFYRLAHHFKPQSSPAMCGPAAAMVVTSAIYELNKKPLSLIEAWPIDIMGKKYPLEYRLINDSNFFNQETDKILNRKAIDMKITRKDGSFGGGIDMEELQAMLKIHGVKSKVIHLEKFDDAKLNSFRALVKSIVNSDKEFLVLNYDHSYKSMIGGHYSPVVAYDEESDSVMMLDVGSHRNPWVWINTTDLYKSMMTKNYTQTAYRGYMIVDAKLSK